MKKLIFVLMLICVTADARPRLFRGRGGSSNAGVAWNGPVGILADDAAACQAEANYMAANNIRFHVFGVIGSFEGVGWGGSNCATCRPSWNATLTGDASAQSASGTVYRVRSWR